MIQDTTTRTGITAPVISAAEQASSLVKLPLSMFVAYSALFGFLIHEGRISTETIYLFSGVLFLACGAAALNNIQDRPVDRLMSRTKHRLLARGLLPVKAGLLLAVTLIGIGLLLIAGRAASIAVLVVSIGAVVLYNGVYTPLKKRSAWALLPGAICGALPPYIGWLMAGGPMIAGEIAAAGFVLFLWQVPHFWLIALYYRHDYRAAGLPNMIDTMPESLLRSLVFLWIVALVSVVHSLLLCWRIEMPWMTFVISGGSLVLLGLFGYAMAVGSSPGYRRLFHVMNGYILALMTCFAIGSVS